MSASPSPSTMDRKFPVLRVPQLILTEIINQIDVEDLIPLSLCSKTMFRLIQFHRTNMKHVSLTMRSISYTEYQLTCRWDTDGHQSRENRMVRVSKSDDQRLEATETVKIANHCVSFSMNDEFFCLQTFWEDHVIGIQEIAIYVAKLLKKDIEYVFFQSHSLWMINWVKTVQGMLKCAIINSQESLNEEQYVQVLEKCDSYSLRLDAKPPPSFEYKKELPERSRLNLHDAFWVTLEHLLNLKIAILTIETSKLTSVDLNTFLKHWLRGGAPHSRFFNVRRLNGTRNALFAGLEEEMVAIQKQRKFKLSDSMTVVLFSGYEIRQEDGKRATFAYDGRMETFMMVVGNDFIETIPAK